MKRLDPALVVVLAGVSAALHVGKLPPALPVLRDALGLTLLQSGFLLSLVQLAGMSLGLVTGLAADSLGLRRCMVAGLLLLGAASAAGGLATGAPALLALRAVEGAGFLLAVLPAPALIRRLVAPARMSAMLGLWGAYMPLGAAVALAGGPLFIAAAGWPGWWWLLGALSWIMAAWLWRAVAPDPPAAVTAVPSQWVGRLRQTLSSPGPWLVASAFAVYSGQWLAVIGFLPSIYAQAGVGAATGGLLTALVAAVNMVGNIASGRLLQRGRAPQRLLYAGFATMGLGAAFAFAPALDGGATLRYGAILLFSMVGGVVPGTLFSLSVRLAPDSGAVATTVGWVQQCSSIGQFAGPPLVAWVAGVAGGWHWTWLATGLCSAVGLVLAWQTGILLRQRR
ncbi:MAG: MFS transporter [Proteobacteria bacterium]|jgi:CP family cyanate transporter-like MFS transporter|nr:MFS transporter [Pseudomonadota bacterium]